MPRGCPDDGGNATSSAKSFRGTAYRPTGGGKARVLGGPAGEDCGDCLWVTVEACRGTSVTLDAGKVVVIDGDCEANACGDGTGELLTVYLLRPGWVEFRPVDEFCQVSGTGIVTHVQLVSAAAAAFTEEDVPVPSIAVQPDRPTAVVRLPVVGHIRNHQRIDDPAFTTAFGINIALRAHPEYHWDFDTGGSAPGAKLPPTNSPGAPYPSKEISYAYGAKGAYQITVRAVWHGEFRIDGITDWTAISGTPTQTSPPRQVDVREARAVLHS